MDKFNSPLSSVYFLGIRFAYQGCQSSSMFSSHTHTHTHKYTHDLDATSSILLCKKQMYWEFEDLNLVLVLPLNSCVMLSKSFQSSTAVSLSANWDVKIKQLRFLSPLAAL